MNYIRCDDTPIVFTHVISEANYDHSTKVFDSLSFCGAGDKLTIPFQPENVCMLPETGRVYHPAPDKFGGIGLIKSSLAIEFSKYFEFEGDEETQPPSHFTWRETKFELTNKLFDFAASRNI